MTDTKVEAAKQLLASGQPPREVSSNLRVSMATRYRWVLPPIVGSILSTRFRCSLSGRRSCRWHGVGLRQNRFESSPGPAAIHNLEQKAPRQCDTESDR